MNSEGGIVRHPPYLCRIYQACYYCYKPQTEDPPLLRCSRCRRVCYDSVECQRADWDAHKKFCKAYVKSERGISILELPSDEQTHDTEKLCARAHERVLTKMKMLASILGRDLNQEQRNLVVGEPRCLACARSEEEIRITRLRAGENAVGGAPLARCPGCQLSFYCSEEHREFAVYRHEYVADLDSPRELSQCGMNQMIRGDLILRESTGPAGKRAHQPWIPGRIKLRWEPLEGRTWASEYEEALCAPPDSVTADYALRHASDDLTYPQTILWALEKLKRDNTWAMKDALTIHILDPTVTTAIQGAVFEEILHRLPKLKNLQLIFCGPEMDLDPEESKLELTMPGCEYCTRTGRKRVHSLCISKYDDWVASQGSAYTAPDLAIGFNVALGSEENVASWRPILKLLIEKEIPSLFTSHNRSEVAVDRKALKEAGAQLVPGLKGLNPWGSQLMLIEPNRVDGLYTHNMYIAGGFT